MEENKKKERKKERKNQTEMGKAKESLFLFPSIYHQQSNRRFAFTLITSTKQPSV